MLTYEDMQEKTNPQLVVYHNELAELCGATALAGWKQAKARLIERIEIHQATIADAEIDAEDEVSPEFEAAVAGEPVTDLEKIVEQALEDVKEDEPKRTIKSASVELLCEVAYFEDSDEKSSDENRVAADHPKARSVGIAYDEVIRRVQDEFNDCKTSVACLRWYSVKIRVEEAGYEGLRLPQRRPRAKPKTPAKNV